MSKNTVQDRLVQLSEMIAWFQSDEFSLEEAIEKYKEAEALAVSVEEDLTKLKNEITVIRQETLHKA